MNKIIFWDKDNEEWVEISLVNLVECLKMELENGVEDSEKVVYKITIWSENNKDYEKYGEYFEEGYVK